MKFFQKRYLRMRCIVKRNRLDLKNTKLFGTKLENAIINDHANEIAKEIDNQILDDLLNNLNYKKNENPEL